jgi:transcription termination factor Rho
VRGYLGNSARARMKDGGPHQGGGDGNGGKRNRRNRGGGGGGGGGPMREEFPDDEEFDVIPAAELESTKNAMNLSELKTRPAAALVQLAESMGLENLARSRKQDIIFSILKAHAKNG